MTVAVTLFALLELYKRGEASWEQAEPFGADHGGRRLTPLAKIVEALLFLSPEPVSLEDLRDATQQDEWAVLDALTELRDGLHGRGVVLKEIGGGWTLASHPGAEEAARRLLSSPARRRSPRRRPRRCRSSPTCSRSRGRRWPASAASPRSPRRARSPSAG